MAYTKLFGSIVHSTIWREPDHVRIVWVTMLAMCDQDGMVEASIPGLADVSRVDLDQCKGALELLSGPDEYSRSPEHEGRRIEAVSGGWRLLNYDNYRKKMDHDEVRAKAAARKARYRAQKSRDVPPCPTLSQDVPPSHDIAEANAEAVKKESCSPSAPKSNKSSKQGKRLPDDWEPTADLLQWSRGERPDLDITNQVEMFRDYWHALPGARARKLDWGLTFKGWIRRADKPKGGGPSPTNTTRPLL